MADTSIGPGTVLAGRYRLDDLLSESEGAKFWRATDRTLARSVAVNVLDDDDPRAEAVLAAARTSATVTDGHFLRVLDAASRDGIVYVVNEWGSGVSLDRLLSDGPLPPRRAAWLVKEVADAITTAHRSGIAHGRLIPENVIVSEAGSVKLIGFVVDCVLHGGHRETRVNGERLGDHETDVVNLAGLLYASLVGRWPGLDGSSLPDAPREHGRPLRPRQVRAGVPRPLDRICERVLNREAHQHAMPIETAQEVSAALSDFIGDPAGPAQVGYEPTSVIPRVEPESAPDMPEPNPPPTAEVPRDEAHRSEEQAEQAEQAEQPEQPEQPEHGAEPADPDATQAGTPLFFDDDSQVGWASPAPGRGVGSREERSAAPPPPLPEPEPRPLFAPDPPAGAGSSRRGTGHRAPAHHPREPVPYAELDHGTGPQPRLWPWGSPEDEGTDEGDEGPWEDEDAGKSWLRLAGIVAACLLLLIAIIIAFNLGRGSEDPGTPATSPEAETSGQTQAPPGPVRIAGVADFDPLADPPEENPDLAPLAVDGDPSTAWQTLTYYGNPELGGLKAGVGLLVDLGRPTEVSRVQLSLVGSPTDLQILAAPRGADRPTEVGGLRTVATVNGAGENVDVELRRPVTTRYLVVWLTSLPPTEGGFQGQVAEIVVRR